MLTPAQPFLGGPAPLSVNTTAALSEALIVGTPMLPAMAADSAAATVSANSATVASAAAVANIADWATESQAVLTYLVANPGAMLLASLPSVFPSSSGQWWIDGQLVARS